MPKKKPNTEKTNHSKKKKPSHLNAKQLTPEEIEMINNSPKIPPAEPLHEMPELTNFLAAFAPAFMQKLFEFINSYSAYYTKQNFMETFGICSNTLKNWMNKKGLPHVKLDSIILFRKSDVDEFFNRFRKIIPLLVTALPGFFNPLEVVCLFA